MVVTGIFWRALYPLCVCVRARHSQRHIIRSLIPVSSGSCDYLTSEMSSSSSAPSSAEKLIAQKHEFALVIRLPPPLPAAAPPQPTTTTTRKLINASFTAAAAAAAAVPHTAPPKRAVIYFEPQLADRWHALTTHALDKLPGSSATISLAVKGQSNEPTTLTAEQVRQLCTKQLASYALDVIDIETEKDDDDEDYVPSSTASDSSYDDDDDCCEADDDDDDDDDYIIYDG